jgi:hypothetical protein
MSEIRITKILTHFTKDRIDEKKQSIPAKDNFISILDQSTIFGQSVGWYIYTDKNKCKAVCLTETSLFDIRKHVEKYSSYGLVFPKKYIMDTHKGNPVFYMTNQLIRGGDPWIDQVKPFIDDYTRGGFQNWDEVMGEREWRVPGDLKFDHKEVAMALVPPSEVNFFKNKYPNISIWFPVDWFSHI